MNYPIQCTKCANGITVISCNLNTDHKDVIQDALMSMEDSFDMGSDISVVSLDGVTVICGILND